MKKSTLILPLFLLAAALSAQEKCLMFGGKVPANRIARFPGFTYVSDKDPMVHKKSITRPWNYSPGGAAMSSGNKGSLPADALLEHGIAFHQGGLTVPWKGKKAVVRLLLGDWFQGWKRLNKNKPLILLAVNGKDVIKSTMSKENAYKAWGKLDEYVFSRKDSIWDRLVKPVLSEETVELDNINGKIEFKFNNILLTAIIIAPDKASLEKTAARVETLRRKEFAKRYPWQPRPDEPMPQAAKGKKFIVFQKHGLDVIYPWSRPADKEVTDTIKVFAAKGEQELFRFGILPLQDMPELFVKVGDFSGPGGRISTASNADFWRERYKEKGSEKMSGLITDMRKLDPQSYVLQENKPQNGEKGTPRMYTLDLRVPDKTAPGLYTAPVAVYSKGKLAGSFKLLLKVLPFSLQYKGSASFNFQQADMIPWASWMRGYTKESIRKELEKRCGFIAKYRFQNDYFCPWGYGYPFRYGTIVGKPGERRFTQTPAQAADMDWWFKKAAAQNHSGACLVKASYFMLNMGWSHQNLFKEIYGRKKITPQRMKEWDTDLKDIERIIGQLTKLFRAKGYPEPYWYYAGELDNMGVRGVQEGVRIGHLIRRAGGTSLVTINGPLAARATPAVYDHIWANPAAPITEKLVADIRKHGHKFGCHNCGDSRFQAGFHFWRLGAVARHQETIFYTSYTGPLFYLPWNYNTAQVYPAMDGSDRPTLNFLNYRDGRDDYLYLFTLENKIKQAKADSPACKNARAFLAQLKKKIHFDPRSYHVEGFDAEEGTAEVNSAEWNSMSIERYRWHIAQLIMALESEK